MQKSLLIHYTPFEDQLVDAMTKALPTTWFSNIHCKLTILPQPVSLREDVGSNN